MSRFSTSIVRRCLPLGVDDLGATIRRASASSVHLQSTSRRKRKRSVNHLNRIRRPQPPFTALDRQRLLMERNLVVRKPLEKRVSQFLDLAESRLTWVRSQLFQLWDPEWKTKSIKGMGGAAAASTTRSPQPLVVMDARWWRWNIAFALLPAILIGSYCEFRGQYMMYKFHQEQELEQAQRLMGEEYVERHRDELIGPPPENIVGRLLSFLLDLKELLLGSPSEMHNLDSKSLPASHSTSAPTPPQPTSIGARAGTPAETSNAAEPPRLAEIATLEQLQDRLEQIEAIVSQQEHIRGSRELAKLSQSGVQNRMEEAMIGSWAKSSGDRSAELSGQHKQDGQDEKSASPQYMVTPVMKTISQFLDRVAQKARDFASDATPGSEEATEVPGLREGVREEPSVIVPQSPGLKGVVREEETSMIAPHVRDTITTQSNHPGVATESDTGSQTNARPSWWRWA